MTIAALSILALGHSGFSGFQDQQLVAEPQRIALTPVIDGKLSQNEWDSFTGTGETEFSFQWEPGTLYASGTIGEGENLVVSLDAESDGWLIGKSNFEFKVSMEEGAPKLKARRLDCTGVSGPAWSDAADFLRSSRVSASTSGNGYFVECAITDSGAGLMPENVSKVGVRLDRVPGNLDFEPYLPRTMTPAELVMDRGSSVPGGLRWKADFISRTVIPGQTMNVRYHFNGVPAMNLTRFEADASQNENEISAKLIYPFPGFDKKGHSAIDFKTPIPANAQTGYRILRSGLTDSAGNTTFIRSSYRVAPMIELSLLEPKKLKSTETDQSLKVAYYVQSNSLKKVIGKTEIILPENWKVLESATEQFTIYNAFTHQKKTCEIMIPAKSKGVFPVTLRATVAEKVYEQAAWIRVQ